MPDLHWKSAITKVEPNKLLLRGYALDELMGAYSFTEIIYLALMGELPDAKLTRLLDAMLVSSVDHGATPPSVLSALTVASTGAPLNAAVAAGVLSISRFHGGAIEDCMRTLLEAVTSARENVCSAEEAAGALLLLYKERGKRASGFGHRIHTKDPRTTRLFALAEEAGAAGPYVEMARAIEKVLAATTGRALPINVDGAIAALLCELEMPAPLANAFFIMARMPGLVAHVFEEQSRQRVMRRIHPTDHEYDGPDERPVPKR